MKRLSNSLHHVSGKMTKPRLAPLSAQFQSRSIYAVIFNSSVVSVYPSLGAAEFTPVLVLQLPVPSSYHFHDSSLIGKSFQSPSPCLFNTEYSVNSIVTSRALREDGSKLG